MIDPRAEAPGKLVAPAPLPHISRRALARVKDWLPPPTACRYCGGPVALVNHSTVYGREYGDWPYIYRCEGCDAMVGLHPHTDLPLGTLANAELRRVRRETKGVFGALIRRFGLSRGAAYRWLAKSMGIPTSACHFGLFEADQCESAAQLSRDALARGHLHNHPKG